MHALYSSRLGNNLRIKSSHSNCQTEKARPASWKSVCEDNRTSAGWENLTLAVKIPDFTGYRIYDIWLLGRVETMQVGVAEISLLLR